MLPGIATRVPSTDMSRIRSQLGTILGGTERSADQPLPPRPATAPDVQRRLEERYQPPRHRDAPARRAAAAGRPADQDLQRLRDQLDRLAGKLETALAVQTRSPARAESRDSGTDSQLDRLRAEIAEIRSLVADGTISNELNGELQRFGDMIAALQHPQERQNAQIATLAGEMRDLRRAMDEMAQGAGRPVDLDMSGVARSIETGYAEIAGRLEDSLKRQLDDSRGDRVSGQIADIADHLAAMRESVDALPDRMGSDRLETRFAELESAIGHMLGSGDDALPAHLSHLGERLDEISRAIVATSANPPDLDNSFERIEARLATLSNAVEEIAGRSQGGDDEQGLAGRLAGIAALPDELNAMIGRIDERLEGLTASRDDEASTLQSLSRQLETIEARLSRDTAEGAEGAQSATSETLQSMEAQLSAIFARLDGLNPVGADAEGRPLLPDRDGEIVASIDALGARIDAISANAGSDQAADDRLQVLEQQLGEIGALLREDRTGGDLAPLAERLAGIEQQLAQSRDLSAEMASQAAERAVELAASRSGGAAGDAGGGSDPAFLEQIAADLRNIEARLERADERDQGDEPAVQSALSQIMERLDMIERGMGDSFGGSSHSGSADVVDLQQDTSERERRDAFATAEDATASAVAQDDRSAHDSHAGAGIDEAHMHRAGDAPSLDIEELPELDGDVEDVPLEPNSGVPDLAALVRDASQKRRAASRPAEEDAGANYLAAARRAAQAAASEAAAQKEIGEQQKKADDGGNSLFAQLGKRRRLLMFATAAIIMAAMVGPLTSRFFAPAEPVAAVETDAVETDADGTRAADDAETGNGVSEPATAPIASRPDQADPETGSDPEIAVTPVDDTSADEGPTVAETTETTDTIDAPSLAEPADAGMAGAGEAGGFANAALQDGAIDGSNGVAPDSTPDPAMTPVAIPLPPERIENAALRQAAAKGDPRALFEIARRYTDGDGLDRDLSLAAQWYERAASRGYAPAQYRLGNFLEKGHGMPVDLPRSAQWYERAATNGNALAMHNLAVLHSTGLLAPEPDMATAIEWFTRAADLGVKDSQVNLGIIHAKGLGTDVDLVASYKWFAIAAKGGDSDAAAKRDMVAEAMRPDQLEEARGLAELWRPAELDKDANIAEIAPEWKDAGGEAASSGSDRELIAQTQRLLSERGFDPGPADGLIGAKTRDAIMRFQKDAGMPVDGTVSPQLLEKLTEGSA